MKSIRILTLALALAAVALPSTSFAGKGNKAGKGAGKAAAQYDTNQNGMIDGDEVDALKKAFDADKTGPLKALDTDGDGKLSDGEISAIKVHKKKAK
jgi:hypothetical protein